jgi:hypothetical protein
MVAAACCGSVARSQTLDTEDRQEFLNRYFPFIEQGQEPPGRYAPSEKLNGGLRWQGQRGWRTRYGNAIVLWNTGEPIEVENARYPDGSRGEARDTPNHGFRRRATGERLWVYGKIDIRPDDVIFIDGDQPVYRPPPQGEVPDLEADLARDPAFLEAIQDDRFTLALLRVLENRNFYKGQDPRAWPCGMSQAAALVANLRRKGESYQDYYPGHAALAGTFQDDRPDIERRLQSRIDQAMKALMTDPPLSVPLEDLTTWLGPGKHSPEEVRRAMEELRPLLETRRPAEIKKYRERWQASLDQAQHELAAFREDHANDDVFETVRAHLSRLGWRTETDQDLKRVHQDWVTQAVQVLQEVKELELRPAASPGAWAEPLRSRRPIGGRAFELGELESMSADVRAVETGELERRLTDLALTGRITEQEYRALTQRSSRMAVILSHYGARTGTGGSAGDVGQKAPAVMNPGIPPAGPINHP